MTTSTTLTLGPEAIIQLANVAMFAYKDDDRPVLSGVVFEVFDDDLRAVATDMHALCIEQLSGEHTGPGGTFNVPVRLVSAALKQCDRYTDEITFIFSDGAATVEVGTFTISETPLIEGDYPNYRALVPSGEPLETASVMLRADMVARLAKLRSDDGAKAATPIHFDLFGSTKPLRIHAGQTMTVVQMPLAITS